MKIYGITVVNSEGFINGKESETIIGIDKAKIINEAWQYYEDVNLQHEDIIETEFLNLDHFIKAMNISKYTYIQLPDHHIQFEYFETEL